jgi:hypothetical protein
MRVNARRVVRLHELLCESFVTYKSSLHLGRGGVRSVSQIIEDVFELTEGM